MILLSRYEIKNGAQVDSTGVIFLLKEKNIIDNQSPTMTSFIENLPSNNWFSIKIVFLATLTSIPSGSVIFINALIAPDLQCEWNLTTFEVTLISIAFYVGEALGSWYWGRMADVYGRKNTLIVSTGSMVYFVLLSAASRSFHLHLCKRLLVAIDLGTRCQSP